MAITAVVAAQAHQRLDLLPGSGGGGGSSFIDPAATVVVSPAASTQALRVTLTYEVPSAVADLAALTFGPQTLGTASPEQVLKVTNQGTGDLVVGAIVLAGAGAGDYLVRAGCSDAVAPGASCTIGVRFSPAAAGDRAATLGLETNAPTDPAAVSLTGVGREAPLASPGTPGATGATGTPGAIGTPGATGTPGTPGAPGATGTPGAIGARGATGPRGPKTTIRSVRCKLTAVKRGKTITCSVTTVKTASVSASLSRSGKVVTRVRSSRSAKVVFGPRALRAGRYSINLKAGATRRTVVVIVS